MTSHDRRTILTTVVIIAAGLVAAYVTLNVLSSIRWLLESMAVALFLSFAGDGAVSALTRKGWKRGIAAGVVLIVLVVLAAGAVWLLIPSIAETVSILSENIDTIADTLGEAAGTVGGNKAEIADSVRDFLENLGTYLGQIASDPEVLQSVGAALGQTLTTIFLLYYLLAEGPKLRHMLIKSFGKASGPTIEKIWDMSSEKVGGFLYGTLLLAVIAGIYAAGITAALGVPAAVGIGAWVVLASLIPLVGGWVAGILPVFATFTYDLSQGTSFTRTLIVLAALFAFQGLDNYLMRPKTMAHTVDVHPVTAFLAVAAGASIAGFPGAILAIPVVAIIYSLTAEWYVVKEAAKEPVIEEPTQDPPDKDAGAGPENSLKEPPEKKEPESDI